MTKNMRRCAETRNVEVRACPQQQGTMAAENTEGQTNPESQGGQRPRSLWSSGSLSWPMCHHWRGVDSRVCLLCFFHASPRTPSHICLSVTFRAVNSLVFRMSWHFRVCSHFQSLRAMASGVGRSLEKDAKQRHTARKHQPHCAEEAWLQETSPSGQRRSFCTSCISSLPCKSLSSTNQLGASHLCTAQKALQEEIQRPHRVGVSSLAQN